MENYSIFGASKDDIVIIKETRYPMAGLVVNPAADEERVEEASGGGDVDNIAQQLCKLELGGVDLQASVSWEKSPEALVDQRGLL